RIATVASGSSRPSRARAATYRSVDIDGLDGGAVGVLQRAAHLVEPDGRLPLAAGEVVAGDQHAGGLHAAAPGDGEQRGQLHVDAEDALGLEGADLGGRLA